MQGHPDKHSVDCGPLRDVAGVDFPLRMKQDQNNLFLS
jgi:hypothetical protein